jgi:hypothetical protein
LAVLATVILLAAWSTPQEQAAEAQQRAADDQAKMTQCDHS